MKLPVCPTDYSHFDQRFRVVGVRNENAAQTFMRHESTRLINGELEGTRVPFAEFDKLPVCFHRCCLSVRRNRVNFSIKKSVFICRSSREIRAIKGDEKEKEGKEEKKSYGRATKKKTIQRVDRAMETA